MSGEAQVVRSGTKLSRSRSPKKSKSRSPKRRPQSFERSASPTNKKSPPKSAKRKRSPKKRSKSPKSPKQDDSPEFAKPLRSPQADVQYLSENDDTTNLAFMGSRQYYEQVRPREEASRLEEQRQKWREERARAIVEQRKAMHEAADEWANNLLNDIDQETP